MGIKVSIIVPIYNTEKYLKKCLDNLVNQTLKDIEIILINDGSIDSSEEIITQYKTKYENLIKYFKQENKGQASARNLGLQNATGEYICFVDSDDYIDVTMCQKLYNKAVETSSEIVMCDFYVVYENNMIPESNMSRLSNDNIKNYILSSPGPCGKIIKKDILINNNFKFPEGIIYEDLAVIPTLAIYCTKIEVVNENLYYYVQRPGSTMNYLEYNKKLENILDAIDILNNEFIKHGKDLEYAEEIEYLYVTHLLHAATLRFMKYKVGRKNISKIINIIKEKFPNYTKNIYFKKMNLKKQIICYLISHNKIWLVRKLLRMEEI